MHEIPGSGLFLDDKLTWKCHITETNKKIIMYAGIFSKMKHLLPGECRNTLYNSFVFSRLNYGTEVYVNAGTNFIQNHPPLGQSPSTQLEGSKNSPPGTIIVYKNPPLGTKQGIKKSHPWDIKSENFTNVSSINSDTI